jgi:RNase H-fold protein (predicted Holliday junction resolvase)
MKYLGIDYGAKRVGVAIAEDGGLAFPRAVLDNNKELTRTITELTKKEQVGTIVIGESLDQNMRPNPIMADIRKFAAVLMPLVGAKIVFHPEYYTSQEAGHIQGENEMHDASAAALILQNYLDRESIRDTAPTGDDE